MRSTVKQLIIMNEWELANKRKTACLNISLIERKVEFSYQIYASLKPCKLATVL